MKALLLLIVWLVGLSPAWILAQPASTLEQIKAHGTLRIGFRPTLPPMSFQDSDGTVVGYSIDICNAIARSVAKQVDNPDLKIDYVPVDAKSRFSALSDNKIDILCGATTKTLSRQENVDFTQLTFVSGGALLSRSNAPVTNVKTLDGKKVAVVDKTTTIHALNAAIARSGVQTEVVAVNNAREGAAALESSQVDAYAADQVVLVGLVLSARNPDDFVVSIDLFSFEPFALAIRRNDADFRLAADRVIARLYRSQDIVEIYRNWFGAVSTAIPGALEALFTLGATPE